MLHPKPAQTDAPVHELFRARWSSRALDAEESLPQGFVNSLLEAARWAPSANNEQPWRLLLYSRDDPLRDQVESCLSPGNASWAPRAALLIVACFMEEHEVKKEGKPAENWTAPHDLGMALMALILQATALELHCHPMRGFDRDRIRKVLEIPPGAQPLVVLAVGSAGERSFMDDRLLAKETSERSRRPIDQIARHGAWSF